MVSPGHGTIARGCQSLVLFDRSTIYAISSIEFVGTVYFFFFTLLASKPYSCLRTGLSHIPRGGPSTLLQVFLEAVKRF